jgi:mannose-6-phosphate isomerase
MLGDILAGDQPGELQAGLLNELVELASGQIEFRHLDASLLSLLAERFGADRGLLLALTMQRFALDAGEAIFVETGVPHCYLHGLGVEVMTSSDNVLRGGLTNKHVSTSDFMAMLDVSQALKTSVTQARALGSGLWRYEFDAEEFVVHRVSVSSSNMLIDFGMPGESILMCLAGELAVSNSLEQRLVLRRGEVAFLSGDARFYSITGSGDGLLASSIS